MKEYFYDLHIHSCLSPCGDDESTPDSIAGMGELNGLDIMALTDHNSCKNCPAFFEAAKAHGVLPVAGMELTTSEEIHLVCLFEGLDEAMRFDDMLQSRRLPIKNRADIFGNQLICDKEDNIIGSDDYLLSAATTISIDEAPALLEEYGGFCFPAHIDRPSNSVTAVLGVFPESPAFSCAELRSAENISEYTEVSRLPKEKLLVSSDAHFLWDIKERCDSILLPEISEENREKVGKILIKALKERL